MFFGAHSVVANLSWTPLQVFKIGFWVDVSVAVVVEAVVVDTVVVIVVAEVDVSVCDVAVDVVEDVVPGAWHLVCR